MKLPFRCHLKLLGANTTDAHYDDVTSAYITSSNQNHTLGNITSCEGQPETPGNIVREGTPSTGADYYCVAEVVSPIAVAMVAGNNELAGPVENQYSNDSTSKR